MHEAGRLQMVVMHLHSTADQLLAELEELQAVVVVERGQRVARHRARRTIRQPTRDRTSARLPFGRMDFARAAGRRPASRPAAGARPAAAATARSRGCCRSRPTRSATARERRLDALGPPTAVPDDQPGPDRRLPARSAAGRAVRRRSRHARRLARGHAPGRASSAPSWHHSPPSRCRRWAIEPTRSADDPQPAAADRAPRRPAHRPRRPRAARAPAGSCCCRCWRRP